MNVPLFLRVSILFCIDFSVVCEVIFEGGVTVEKNEEAEFSAKENISKATNITKNI